MSVAGQYGFSRTARIDVLLSQCLHLPFLYLTLKSSRDDFNVLNNFNVSSIKTAIYKPLASTCVVDNNFFSIW